MVGWVLAAWTAMAAVQPAQAQGQVSAEHQPARLDRLLEAKDYAALGDTIAGVTSAIDMASDLDWLKAQMLEGNSAFISMLYARQLWILANHLPAEKAVPVKRTAAMATVYAYAAITVDGVRCGDRSAPSRRAEQLMTWIPIWPFIRSLSAEERQALTQIVVALESRTAAQRGASGDVDFLCRNGLEEMRYNMEHGTAREVPTPAGGIGRTVELYGDGNYEPSVRPESEWRPEAMEARSSLPAELSTLINGPGKAGTPASDE